MQLQILVIAMPNYVSTGWSRGTDPITGRSGFFPSDYVRKELPVPPVAGTSAPMAHGVHFPPHPSQTQFHTLAPVNAQAPLQTPRSLPHPALTAVALYDFVSSKPNEQQLKKGEIVRVVAKGPAGGWTKGERGVFPTDYVRFQDFPQSIQGTPKIPTHLPSNPAQTMNSFLTPQPTAQAVTPSGLPLSASSSIGWTAQPSSVASTPLANDFGEFQAGDPILTSPPNLDLLSSAFVETTYPNTAVERSTNVFTAPSSSMSVADAFEFVDKGKSQQSSESIVSLIDFSPPSTVSSATESKALGPLPSKATGQVPPSLLVPSTKNVDALLYADFVDVDKSNAQKSNTATLVESFSDFNSIAYDKSKVVSGGAIEKNTILDDLLAFPSTTALPRGKGTIALESAIDRGDGADSRQKVFIGSLHKRNRSNEQDARRGRDRQVFSLNESEEEQRAGIWTQPFFSDLFTSSLIKRVDNSSTQPVMARLGDAFQAVRLAIAQVKGLARRDGEIADVLSLVSSAFKEARDVCNEVPINAQDHQKFADFLTRFMPRVKHLRQGELVVSPCVWSSASTVVEDEGGTKGLSHNFHGVIILVYRTTEGTEEDFSLTIVNTSTENKGLEYHAIEVDNADGSTLFNVAFELVNIPNARIQNTAFWLFCLFIYHH